MIRGITSTAYAAIMAKKCAYKAISPKSQYKVKKNATRGLYFTWILARAGEMILIKWLLLVIGMLPGVFTPWQYQVAVMATLLLGYAGCYELKWKRFQLVLAYLFGGIATGLGLQVLIGYGVHNAWLPMIISPLIIWLVLRVIFYAIETKYTLHPNAALSLIRNEENTVSSGHSNWGSDHYGKARVPDSDGRYMMYTFFYSGGEIAMGGPTFGEVVFNNRCAFSGVGPSIGLSEDGRYAAMSLPSRDAWGLLIVDLHKKCVYSPNAHGIQTVDRIEDGIIYDRQSTLSSDKKPQLNIAHVIESSKAMPLIEDDGWWVIDSENRTPFPSYSAITVPSEKNAHRVTFVPDLKPYKENPFARFQAPSYSVLVDDVLLDFETNSTIAIWVNGVTGEAVYEGRFLCLAGKIFDFKCADKNTFSSTGYKTLALEACDLHTYLNFDALQASGDARILAKAIAMPLGTSFSDAETTYTGNTYPWDEEEAQYWDINGHEQVQARDQIQRQIEYNIDLNKYSDRADLRRSVSINLVNRTNAKHSASLECRSELHINGEYAGYSCNTSCGIVLDAIIHEAIWSRCGRYLAVVYFESPPKVPSQIALIDFETAHVRNIPGSYALPSFIWFDDAMLQFTHMVGVSESITRMPGNNDEKILRLSEPEHAALPYDLLTASIKKRQQDLDKKAAALRSKNEYTSATVSRVAQHCILFSPDFEKPILQPPKNCL
jgi:hypothetical protein